MAALNCQDALEEEEEEEEVTGCSQASCSSTSCCNPQPTTTQQAACAPLCIKCKQRAGQVMANQTEPMCSDCLRLSLLSKLKTALNQQGAVTGSDRVLVGFSGGSASRVLLHFLCELRSKLQEDANSCKDRNVAVFEIGVAFVDESAALGFPFSATTQETLNEISSIVAEVGPWLPPLHLTSLESLFQNKENDSDLGFRESRDRARMRVMDLLSRVEDQTGKEDLVEHLRMDALQRVAQDFGYSKVVLGLCTTRIAARVLAATAKGEGFALPAGIQYIDARWQVPVVLPLRDCVAKELAVFCHLTNLKTVFIKKSTMANSSINSLTNSFVSLINEENPSREHTIVRTATKLIPFSFNKLALEPMPNGRLRKSRDRRDLGEFGNPEFDLLCPICKSPVTQVELDSVLTSDSMFHSSIRFSMQESVTENSSTGIMSESTIFREVCCPSCQFQIIPDKSKDSVFASLPPVMQQRATTSLSRKEAWMRERIGDCLIKSDE